MPDRSDRVAGLIRNIPDFPKPGVQFKDITPLLSSPRGFHDAINEMLAAFPEDIDCIAGVESRGFLFGAPMALALNIGFVPIRKPGKLPSQIYAEDFDLEYGTSQLQMHTDAIKPGQRVAIIDDLLATGGTLVAAAKLVEQAGGIPAHFGVLIELEYLDGQQALSAAGLPPCHCAVSFG